jgi:hypothetical protein
VVDQLAQMLMEVRIVDVHSLVMCDANACWRSHPEEWQPIVDEWSKLFRVSLQKHSWVQYGGCRVEGLTVTDRIDEGNEKEVRLLVTVPHAHEPAGTAVCVDFACQLLTGHHLDGSESKLPISEILERALITLLPDTNSQGRAKSPVKCWDGTKFDNESFLKVAFGIASDGSRFGRYPEWRYSEHKPKSAGIIYEQIDDDTFVEPNTSKKSTHSFAIDVCFYAFHYTHYLELHQHEVDEAVLLPSNYDELSLSEKEELNKWSEAILEAWKEIGATPTPQPFVPYAGQQRQQFLKAFWDGRDAKKMKRLSIEVRNNRHAKTGAPTPLEHLFKMALCALTVSVLHLLGIKLP